MNREKIKKSVLQYEDWWFWAERPFRAFIMSLFAYGEKREYMRKVGPDVEWPTTLFQKGAFYRSEKVWDDFARELQKNYIDKGGSVFAISQSCEEYWQDSKSQIQKINQSNLDPLEKLKLLYEILTLDISYVWLTHGLEHLYRKILYKEAPKYYKGDVDKFIGDASYPQKKNAYYYLEADLRSNKSLREVQENWGWIKVRDGFSDPYSIKELAEERQRLGNKKPAHFHRPEIPKQLQELFGVAQELVYLRTLRTDVLYNLIFTARPTLRQVAVHFGLSFKELIDYSALDLIDSKAQKYPHMMTYLSFNGEHAFFDEPVFADKVDEVNELRGMIANHGIISGKVKIVKTAYEIGKVNDGDILVAPTTAPSYIIGMKKASAFVTDEGGITSHAAIVARELRKPCIIGTKIATQVLKDGDLVEVDANKGIVRKL